MVVRNGMLAFPVRDIRIEQGWFAKIGTGLAGLPDAECHWMLSGGTDSQVLFFESRCTHKEDSPLYEKGKGIVAESGHGSFITRSIK